MSAMHSPSGTFSRTCSRQPQRTSLLSFSDQESSQEDSEEGPLEDTTGSILFSGGANAGGAPLSNAFFKRLARANSLVCDVVTRPPIARSPSECESTGMVERAQLARKLRR